MDDKNNKQPRNQNKSKNTPRRTKKVNSVKKEEKSIDIKQTESASKSSKASTLKDVIALFEKIGYKKVSNKTFINEEDLHNFLHQDFTNINRTKALGFINILEREYPVDLSELRVLYIAYYRDHKKDQEHKELFVHSKEKDENIWKKYLLWALVPIVGAIALWYMLVARESYVQSSQTQNSVITQDINSDIVKKAEENIVAYDNNKTEEKKISEDVLRIDASAKVEQNTTTVSSNNMTIGLEDDLDLDAIVKQMIRENNISVESANITSDDNSTKMQKNSETDDKADNQSKPLAKQSDSTTKNIALGVKEQQIKKKPKQKTVSGNIKQISIKNKAITKSKLYIEPLKKTWVGVIYLDDYTKKDFLVKSLFKLNPTRPQLIVVGHKFFEIYNNGYSYRFRGNGPIRFIYKDGDIMQVNKNEFLTYSRGVNW